MTMLFAFPDLPAFPLCAETDPDAFHPEQHETARASAAAQVCGRCEAREACLQFALDNDERHGIWGGLTPRQRDELHRSRRRGDRTPSEERRRAMAEAVRMRARDTPVGEIAAHLKVTKRTVHRLLKDAAA